MSAAARFCEEDAGGPAARALFEQYMALLRDRLGSDFVPSERIFATENAFAGVGAVWIVAYDERGSAIACGGLRTLAPGVGEIKRMFVAASARGRGHGRALLGELERRAAAIGLRRARVLTTEALAEACALYASAGYREIERVRRPGHPEEIWMEKNLR